MTATGNLNTVCTLKPCIHGRHGDHGPSRLATLGAHVWRSVASVACGTTTVSGPVANRLAGKAWSTEERAARAGGVQLCQLIESEDLTTVVHDASTSRLGDTEGTEPDTLGGLEHAHIIGDGTHNNHHGAFLLVLAETRDLGQRERWAVHAAHEKPLQDDFVEVGLDTAGQEAVELHEQTNVNILCLGGFPVGILDPTAGFNIDTIAALWIPH